MLKRRSRIVSFRLSDEEYKSLKSVSAQRGARSVSEFTRSVAFGNSDFENHNRNSNLEESMGDTMRMIRDRMEALDSRIRALCEEINNKNAPGPADPTTKKEPVE